MLKQELGLKPGSQISQSAVLQVRLAKPKLSQSLQSTRSPRDVGWLQGAGGCHPLPSPIPQRLQGPGRSVLAHFAAAFGVAAPSCPHFCSWQGCQGERLAQHAPALPLS